MTQSDCDRCGGTGRVPHFVPLFPQIDSKACPECRPGEKVCICCGTSSPGDDCPTCDEPEGRRVMLSDQTSARFPNDAVETVARDLATDPRNWSKAHTTLGWFQVLSDMRRIVGGMDDAGQARFCEWLTERDGEG